MDQASSTGPLSNSADTGAGGAIGLRSPADAALLAVIGAVGGARLGEVGAMFACRGRFAVQRSVHDLASLQYQRMSAQAWPPSGTISPIGSAIPHSEHWADCNWRRRSLRCLAIDAPHPVRCWLLEER